MQSIYEPVDYKKYLIESKLYEALGVNVNDIPDLLSKKTIDLTRRPDPENTIPYPVEWDDLIRLHFIVTTRKVTNILEFGIGKSTFIFDHALSQNKLIYSDFVRAHLRRESPFICDTVDDDMNWFKKISEGANTKQVRYHYSDTIMSTFNDRVCTYYQELPNNCPDLIYLDGPDQFSPKGDVRGVSTRSSDRLPMSADILALEHFLLPGTLIIVDGRTANARFLRANFQRDWSYYYSPEFDQHFFELLESPLGVYNEAQINFCLGNEFYVRLSENKRNKCD